VKDSRPLQDKQFQQSQVRKILDFLRKHNYANQSLTSKHFPLSTKEFVNVFNFVYSFINPKNENILPSSRFEEHIISLLKELMYPGSITKSSFLTMGSLHSYPAVLGSLAFVTDLANTYANLRINVNRLCFPNKDEFGFNCDTDSRDKLVYEHMQCCFSAFNQGADSFEDELQILHENLMENNGVNINDIKCKENAHLHLEEELRELELMDSNNSELEERIRKLKFDETKVQEYLENMDRRNAEKEKSCEEMQATIDEVGEKVLAMEQVVGELKLKHSDNKKVSQLEIERNKLLVEEKKRAIENVGVEIEEEEKEVWNKEIQVSRIREGLEKFVKQINTACLEEELVDSSGQVLVAPQAKFIATGKDAEQASQNVSEFKETALVTKKALKDFINTLEEDTSNGDNRVRSLVECRDVKESDVRRIEMENEKIASEIDSFKSEMVRDVSHMDNKIDEYRQTIIQLKSSERPDIEALKSKLTQCQVDIEEAKVLQEAKKAAGLKFLDKTAAQTRSYVEENELKRKEAVKLVEAEALRKLDEVKASCCEVLHMKETVENINDGK